MDLVNLILIIIGIFFVLSGFRIIRPTERGVKETFGKYTGYINSGLKWIIPFVQKIYRVNVTERIADVTPQDIITLDNLNANVDLVVFYKVREDVDNIKKAFYNVNDVKRQIITLAQTTARNVIGDMNFKDVNSKRNELNKKLQLVIDKQTDNWGVQIIRVELKEISPPRDVQDTMNAIIKANNEKEAAVDFATAKETEADGIKRAAIKEAEGIAQGKKIVADANAYKIKQENEAAQKYFKAQAVKLKELEVTQESIKNNSKLIIGKDGKDILKLFHLNQDKK